MKRLLATTAMALALLIAPAHAASPNWERVNHYLLSQVDSRFTDQQAVCMATNIYFEARGSTIDDMIGVANVTKNRVRHNLWGSTICDVVWEKQQFSWTIKPQKVREDYAWNQAQLVAALVLANMLDDNTGGATHFHAKYTQPAWIADKKTKKTIGQHVYYTLKTTANYDIKLVKPYVVKIASAAFRIIR